MDKLCTAIILTIITRIDLFSRYFYIYTLSFQGDFTLIRPLISGPTPIGDGDFSASSYHLPEYDVFMAAQCSRMDVSLLDPQCSYNAWAMSSGDTDPWIEVWLNQ